MQAPQVGRRFGRYLIRSQIGAGGMGVVYAAEDTHMNRMVALKVVSGRFADSQEFRHRFQREADTLARLDSPHIVAIFDHGEIEGLPYLATQYVRGGDLGTLLRERGAAPVQQALSVCSQMAEALHDAHRVGVVHRDIKPSNVLVRDPDAARLHAYLCDFGIAQDQTSTDPLTAPGGVVGTWAYLAPERGQGTSATEPSDIYSLGCLLWVCMTGDPPYLGTDITVAMAHLNAPVRQLEGATPPVRHLNEVLRRAMAKDPSARFATARQFREALEAAPDLPMPVVPVTLSGSVDPPTATARRPLGPPPVRPPAVPPTEPTTRRPRTAVRGPAARSGRRRRFGWALVIAMVVLLAAGAIAWARLGNDRPSAGPTDPTDDPEPTSASNPVPVTGDIDGNGLGDAEAVFQDGTDNEPVRYTFDSTGDSFVTTDRPVEGFEELTRADWDGDGQLEELLATVEPGGGLVLELTGSAYDNQRFSDVAVTDEALFVAPMSGDFDGDGSIDLAVWGQTAPRTVSVWVLANDGSAFAPPELWTSFQDASVYTTGLYASDFDDDGDADLMARLPMRSPAFDESGATYDGPLGLQFLPSSGTGFDGAGELRRVAGLQTIGIVVGDFGGAGDSLVALLDGTQSPARVIVYRFDENGLEERVGFDQDLLPNRGYTSSPRGVASDVDGDGTDDLVFTQKSSATTFVGIGVAVSTGDGFGVSAWAKTPRCREDICLFYFPAGL